MANLKLFQVNKVYDGGVHAVKDFCLNVEDKQFVVFVGPSGCGKSTVLRMIAGLEKISSGDLYIGDRLVNALPAKERNIAMVFQNYALFPNMSVYDNISYGLRMQGEDKDVIRKKVTEAAQLLNLTPYLYRKPSQLSGGQKQRVALGRAIVRNPDVFLLDEPLSNLDAKLRNKMRNELQALHRRLDATFIYVTHDQVEAMTMGDQIVVMKDGMIMQTGSPETLYRYPANIFVAGFIGTPQMNFWPGQITTEGGLAVECAIGRIPLEGELALRLEESARVHGKKVVLGLRPEDVYVSRKSDADVEMTAKIRVVEDFCSYAVFHGEVADLEVVGQDNVGMELFGKTVPLYANVANLHIFDGETEQSLLPRYAAAKTVEATKEGEKLHILGGWAELPQQVRQQPDGTVKVRVPADAFTNGEIPAQCLQVMETEDGPVSLLQIGAEKLYARGDYSRSRSFGLDSSRLDISGCVRMEAVPRVSELTFTYEKKKESRCADVKHYCVFGDERMESYYEFNKKMYRMGRSVFRGRYRMSVSLDAVRPAAENECYPCFRGKVLGTMDYGDKRYSQVSVGEETLFVQGTLPEGETVTLAVDLDRVHVRREQSQTILF